MLIQLQIENFRSIDKKISFNTLQRNVKRFSEHVYEHKSGLKLLKTNGIYGPNGSGKTNLFRALYFLKRWLEEDDFLSSLEGRKFFTAYKLNDENNNRPTIIEVDFITDGETAFVYKVEVLLDTKTILSEILMQIEPKELVVFERSLAEGVDVMHSAFSEFDLNYFHSTTRKDKLILSSDYLRNKDMDDAYVWFTNKIEFLFPIYTFSDITHIFNLKPEYLNLANEILKISEIGIVKLDIAKIPINQYFGLKDKEIVRHITDKIFQSENNYYSFKDNEGNYCSAIREDNDLINVLKLICYHEDINGQRIPFDVDQESRGTQVLLHLIPAILRSYGEGINYFLDDINTSLHPILLREILMQYVTQHLGSAKGQLIFNSHEDLIMDETIFRQDEIWLMDKENGSSIIFPLSEFDVRFDLNYRKNYLNGKFGGVPFKHEPAKLVFGE